jgi:hypothetical protein
MHSLFVSSSELPTQLSRLKKRMMNSHPLPNLDSPTGGCPKPDGSNLAPPNSMLAEILKAGGSRESHSDYELGLRRLVLMDLLKFCEMEFPRDDADEMNRALAKLRKQAISGIGVPGPHGASHFETDRVLCAPSRSTGLPSRRRAGIEISSGPAAVRSQADDGCPLQIGEESLKVDRSSLIRSGTMEQQRSYRIQITHRTSVD